MAIIISKNGEGAKKVNKSDFESENYMQNYIHKNPDAIPVYEIQKDKKLFVAVREFPTNSGPIDALAFDQDGDIYIVETKLFRNSDKRTVVAQALDYGSALWKHLNDFNAFINLLSTETQNNFDLNFEEKIQEFFELDDEQLDKFLRILKNNLNDGNLKFVILMDEMDERLKDLIIYINQNSQFDIYAVQLEYYKHAEFEIMIPKIFGVQVKKNIRGDGRTTIKRDKAMFLKELGDNTTVKKLLEIAEQGDGDVKFGSGKSNSLGYNLKLPKGSVQLFYWTDNGTLSFDMGWYKNVLSEDLKNTYQYYIESLKNLEAVDEIKKVPIKGNRIAYEQINCKTEKLSAIDLEAIKKTLTKTAQDLLKIKK